MSRKQNIEIRYHSPEDLKNINKIKEIQGIKTKSKLLTFLLHDYHKNRKNILELKSELIRIKLNS